MDCRNQCVKIGPMRRRIYSVGLLCVLTAACSSNPFAEPVVTTPEDRGPPTTVAPPVLPPTTVPVPEPLPTTAPTSTQPEGTTLPPVTAEPEAERLDPVEISRRHGNAALKVFYDACGLAGSGSGFAINQDYFVTNAHVVGPDPTPTLELRDGTVLTSTLIGLDQELDVAVLRVDPGSFQTIVQWGDSDLVEEGQPLTVIGYPENGPYDVVEVSVRSLNMTNGVPEFRVTGGIDAGNSGSAAFDEYGRVVGIARAVDLRGFEVDGLLIPASIAIDMINAAIASPQTYTAPCDNASTTTIVPVPSTVPPSTGSAAPGSESFGTWLMVLASADANGGSDDLTAEFERLAAEIPGSLALLSDDWPDTFDAPDRVIFYVGGFSGRDAVVAECERLGRVQPDNCLPRLLQ